MQNGPFDYSNVKCYVPTGCCPIDPCKVSLDDFICAVRALLPPGAVFNTTAAPIEPPVPVLPPGVGCITVGCDPVCGAPVPDPECDNDPRAPQLAIVDAFAATSFTAVEALCCMLVELDPCTAQSTVDRWLARYGVPQGACDPTWSIEVKALLLCMLSKVSHNFVLNKKNLDALGSYFGVNVRIFNSGEFNCGGLPGLFTLARTRGVCTPSETLPCTTLYSPLIGRDSAGLYQYLLGKKDDGTYGRLVNGFENDYSDIIMELRRKNSSIKFNPPCAPPPSLDLVVCQTETTVLSNCLLPGPGYTVTPTQELYEAFLWLLNRLISAGTDICIYRCEDVPCLENA